MTLLLRYMTVEDIPQVIEIDREAFSTPWSAKSYTYEVTESTYSYMVVLEDLSASKNKSRWNWLPWGRRLTQKKTHLLAYGGLWCILDEAHISTIAVTASQRGNGYGEILLAAMVRRAFELNTTYVVLEVRVSNKVAQNLYKKYGFQTTGIKKNYYRDNGEDAYDMRLDINAHNRQDVIARFEALKLRFPLTDVYTLHAPPSRSNN